MISGDEFLGFIEETRENIRTSLRGWLNREPSHVHYLQDNARVHTARVVRNYIILRAPFRTIDFPARSPDLNVIENEWGNMSNHVIRDRHFINADHAFQELSTAWDDLDQDYLQNLVCSMPERIQRIIEMVGDLH